MLKVCAILPGTAIDSSMHYENYNICVITGNILKNDASSFACFEKLGLEKKYNHTVGSPLSPDYIEYLALCKRMVGSLHSTTFEISCWDKVIGKNSVSGLNPSSKFNQCERIWEVEERPMDAEKSIYLTRLQLSLLSTTPSDHLITILIAEFGGGNIFYFSKF